MPLFTSKARVAVHKDESLPAGDPQQNTVYIKARMSFRDTAIYKDFLISSRAVNGTIQTHLNVGTAELELLRLNVLGWSGPDFVDEMDRKVPYSADAIDYIEPNDPFWRKVLAEIDQRNKAPEDDAKKKLTTSDGDEPLQETPEMAMAGELVTSSSASLNGTHGRRIKSVN